MAAIVSNPLIRLEFLRRFRSSIAAWGIPLLTLIPGVAVSVAYSAGTNRFSSGPPMQFDALSGQPLGGGFGNGVTISQISSFGMPMYVALFAAVVFTLMVLVPAVVGGSISSERGNMTLQPLQLTALRPFDIVIGKLIASLAYLVLLLLCLTPVMATPFLVGGVPFLDVVRSFGLLILLCIELAAVALAVSAVITRTATSIVAAIVVTGALVVGPFIAMGLAFYAQSDSGRLIAETSVYRLLACLSPVSLFAWSGQLGDFDPGGFAGPAGRVGAIVCWILITGGALTIARRAVTAPVSRDR